MNCTIDAADLEITRGNNHPPAKWQFLVSEDPDVLFDLTGSVFKLMVKYPGGSISKSTGVDPELSIDLATSIVTWAFSIAQSRLFPVGRLTFYELERWIDATQQTHIQGAVIVKDGLNPD